MYRTNEKCGRTRNKPKRYETDNIQHIQLAIGEKKARPSQAKVGNHLFYSIYNSSMYNERNANGRHKWLIQFDMFLTLGHSGAVAIRNKTPVCFYLMISNHVLYVLSFGCI